MSSISSSLVSTHKIGVQYVTKPNSRQTLPWSPILKFSISKTRNQISIHGNKRNSLVVYAEGVQGPAPLPSGSPPSGSSKNWIFGFLVSFILPFFTQKLGPISVLKNRIMGTIQMVEDITEGVEKMAEEVDKIAENIGHDLPDGNLKHLAEIVEHLAEKTAKTAGALDDAIDKVQEAEEKVECIIVSTVANKRSKKDAKDH